MRSKEDFNKYYQIEDPWGVKRVSNSRNYILKKMFKKHINNGDRVIEIGCGEGNFSKFIDNLTEDCTGIDISDIAINRAKKLNLKNFAFLNKDLLEVNYLSFDIVIAVEVIYYLSNKERVTFFESLKGKKIRLIFSTPIIGKNQYRIYFKNETIKRIVKNLNFRLIEEKNLNFYGSRNFIFRILNKIFFNKYLCETYFSYKILQFLPKRMIYQKAYVIDCN